VRQHYERVIVFCCFLALFVNIGFPSTSFPVYQPYLVAIEGIGDTGGSIILLTRTGVALVVMFFVNAFFRRVDVRTGVFLATLCTALAFFLYAGASSFAMYCAASAISGIGYGFGGMVALTMLISRWFKSHMGRAIGIGSLGSGVASIIVPVVALQFIHGISLSASFLFEAILALIGAVLLLVLLRNDPHDMGLEPYHDSKGEGADGKKKRSSEIDESKLTPIPKRTRALLVVAVICVGMCTIGGQSYLSVAFTTAGFSSVFGGLMVSLAGACLTVSKFATGELMDRFGPRKGTLLVFVIYLVGFAAICIAVVIMSGTAALLGTICYGLGNGVGTVGVSMWSLELSDLEHRSRSIRNYQICYALGGVIVNFYPGILKELTGSYLVSYEIMLAAAFAAVVIIVAAYRRYRPTLG
jgi:MFS family permease